MVNGWLVVMSMVGGFGVPAGAGSSVVVRRGWQIWIGEECSGHL